MELILSCQNKMASLIKIKTVLDDRGLLTAGEYINEIPFPPKRFFVISNVPSLTIRGEHAHKKCEQFLVCIKGKCDVILDNGKEKITTELNNHNLGLYLPPMIWGIQHKYSNDAILLVLASDPYDSEDYIRDYSSFITMINLN